MTTKRNDWPIGALLEQKQGRLSPREVSERAEHAFSHQTWRNMVSGYVRKNGVTKEYVPEVDTVLAVAKFAGIPAESAMLMCGLDPQQLEGEGYERGRPDMSKVTTEEMLAELRSRIDPAWREKRRAAERVQAGAEFAADTPSEPDPTPDNVTTLHPDAPEVEQPSAPVKQPRRAARSGTREHKK